MCTGGAQKETSCVLVGHRRKHHMYWWETSCVLVGHTVGNMCTVGHTVGSMYRWDTGGNITCTGGTHSGKRVLIEHTAGNITCTGGKHHMYWWETCVLVGHTVGNITCTGGTHSGKYHMYCGTHCGKHVLVGHTVGNITFTVGHAVGNVYWWDTQWEISRVLIGHTMGQYCIVQVRNLAPCPLPPAFCLAGQTKG